MQLEGAEVVFKEDVVKVCPEKFQFLTTCLHDLLEEFHIGGDEWVEILLLGDGVVPSSLLFGIESGADESSAGIFELLEAVFTVVGVDALVGKCIWDCGLFGLEGHFEFFCGNQLEVNAVVVEGVLVGFGDFIDGAMCGCGLVEVL